MTAKPASKRTSVPFSLSSTGHLLVKARIGGNNIRLVVDTAANSYLILDSTEASRLNLEEDPSSRKHDAKGLGTSSHTVSKLAIPSFSLGDAELLSPPCHCMDLSAVKTAGGPDGLHGLIGSSFLKRHAAVIDFETMQLSFLREPGPADKDMDESD